MSVSILREFAVIAVAGAAGAVCRYAIGLWCMRSIGGHFPWGTLTVNVVGCFLMGLTIHFGEAAKALSPLTTLALAVGFLGALTTFSAFGVQTYSLWEHGRSAHALANIGANLLLALLATWVGITLGRAISPLS